MRNAASLAAILMVAATGVAGGITGEWQALVSVVPSAGLEECSLTLNYTPGGGWTLWSLSEFGSPGLVDQGFGIRGAWGPISITGGVTFNAGDTTAIAVEYPSECDQQTGSYTPTVPAYKEAWTKLSLAFAGAEFSLEFHHWAYPYHLEDDAYIWPCCPPQTQSYTLLSIEAAIPPVSLKIGIGDCCSGFSFSDATLSLNDVGLCCGLSYDAELHLTKAGFDYFTTAIKLEICCGIGIEVETTFTLTEKTVTVKPMWNGMGQACFELYGNILVGQTPLEIQGIEIYGYKLRCDFSSCSYIELLSALNVSALEELLDDEELFEDDEFEYLKMAFCGPGCCGGNYVLGLAVYFQLSDSLFGLSRIVGDLWAPIMANFDLRLSLGVTMGGGTEVSLGWAFRF